MPTGMTNNVREQTTSTRLRHELAPLRSLRAERRLPGSLLRVKAILDAGESLWTLVIMLAGGYAITIPAFLLMWGAATIAAHLVGGG